MCIIKTIRKAIHCIMPQRRPERENPDYNSQDNSQQQGQTPHDYSNLIGRQIIATGHCAACPLEPTDCVKLILADGAYICVK